MKHHLKLQIKGRVQGVFFEYKAKQLAAKLNISGFALDSSCNSEILFMEIEGEQANIDHFISWCARGPYLAHVENITIEERDYLVEYVDFEIRN